MLLKLLRYILVGDEKRSGRYPLVNGVPASKAQLLLADQMGVRQKYVNYKVCGFFVDIALPRKRVAVEYDHKHWHSHRRFQDMQRVKALNRCGWKVLSVYTDKVPPADWVWDNVRELERSRKKFLEIEY